jgi:hypothetical protein
VCDRNSADPVKRFGGPEAAYEALAVQLLHGSIRRLEIVSVLADNYSTRPGITMEENIRRRVNQRLRRLAVTSVVRVDSRAADPLQLTDLLVSAVTFQFRESAKLAASNNAKAELAQYVRKAFGVGTFLNGHQNSQVNVQLYHDRRDQERRRAIGQRPTPTANGSVPARSEASYVWTAEIEDVNITRGQ